MIRTYVDEANAWRMERHQRLGEAQTLLEMPRFAFLRLEPVTRWPGSSKLKTLEDVRRLIDYVPSRTYKLPVRAGNELCFAGAGYDSVISRLLDEAEHTSSAYPGCYALRNWVSRSCDH